MTCSELLFYIPLLFCVSW